MAKKDDNASKKSAIPYTPEVAPNAAKKASKPVATARTADLNPPQVAQEVPTLTKPAPKPVAVPAAGPAAVAPKPSPAPAAVAAKSITWQDIAERAYYIALSGTGGSEDDNWLRAEAELKRESQRA